MGNVVKGQVVVVGFPFSDLSQTKKRPALVLAEVEYGDLLLCQITSKTYGARNAVEITATDFASGSLPLTSYARPSRLFTAEPSLVQSTAGQLTEAKRKEVGAAVGAVVA